MNRKYLVDVAERTAATFAFAFLSAYSFTDLGDWRSAAVAGGAAAATVLKGLIAGYLSAGSSAGLGLK